MTSVFRPRTLLLLAGDIVFFALALYLSLYVRVLELPTQRTFFEHLYPFSLLFVAWVAVYFIAGLYESRSILLARRALSTALLVAQILNMVIAALFFFFVPLFGIAPKTLLVIYLVVSFLLVLFWRVGLFPWLGLSRPEAALLVGDGAELAELAAAMNEAHRAPVRVEEVVPSGSPDLARAVLDAMERHRARVVIADFDDMRIAAAFPHMYNLLSVGVRFVDAKTLYEDLFGRIPLSRLSSSWLARNVSRYAHGFYDVLKRAMDIAVALPAGLLSLVFYPFVIVALKLQDGGDVIISMPRVGENGKIFSLYKFRSMSGNDKGQWQGGTTTLRVTPVGKILRDLRLDELPQLWNVLRGDLSLIGPRPEFPPAVKSYEQEIPYYGVRHLIKPGLSGWAQLYHDNHPHHGLAVEATSEKLSYDLYYLKHRSLLLDAVIVLKTIKKLLTRSGV